MDRQVAAQRHPHRQRAERAKRERDAPAERDRQNREREPAHEDRGRDARLLDAEAESLPIRCDLLGYEQIYRRLADGIGYAGHGEQNQQHSERLRHQRSREQARRGDQDAAAHRTDGAHVVGKPAAPARRDRSRQEEHRDPRGHRLHAHVEVGPDLKRQGAHEEARQDARRACRDRER